MARSPSPRKITLPPAVRSPAEPIIEPRSGGQYWWESLGTFNPGVTEYKGQVLLLYRAYDSFRISRLGLANSPDGIHFTRYDHPSIDTKPGDEYERLGIEDPRITKIDDIYYIVHTSASYHEVGHGSDVRGIMDYIPWRVRIGMHSTKDFHTFTHHGIIFPDVSAKNACLLPTKKDGQFGMYYRENTDEGVTLKLAWTSDFMTWSEPIVIHLPQTDTWQHFKAGTGSPPLLTAHGSLMVYHAVDDQMVYRLGLLMFNKDDPTRIDWYSDSILQPEMSYEKEGFIPNVVYTCGALIRGEELWIYYGAADKVIGRAILTVPSL